MFSAKDQSDIQDICAKNVMRNCTNGNFLKEPVPRGSSMPGVSPNSLMPFKTPKIEIELKIV